MDIQSVSKKAIIRSLQRKYKVRKAAGERPCFPYFYKYIYVDAVTVAINTSGAGLNRRGLQA
jgi:putative N6-adenine-specific DNA methylase